MEQKEYNVDFFMTIVAMLALPVIFFLPFFCKKSLGHIRHSIYFRLGKFSNLNDYSRSCSNKKTAYNA